MLEQYSWQIIKQPETEQDMLMSDIILYDNILKKESEDNDADIFTKNVSQDLYENIQGSLFGIKKMYSIWIRKGVRRSIFFVKWS